MAKQKAKKGKKQQPEEKGLPRNILAMGERVEEDKNIYISQSAYKDIHRFTKNKRTNESGGFLIGSVTQELGKTNILIKAFIEARNCEATPTTLTFTHDTWNEAHKEVGKRFPKDKILGWIHTHPDFGIFLSEYDKFIHENYFSGENQIAMVVDPIRHIEGFYFWINGRLEKCPGFYIYEKTGVRIDIETDKTPPIAEAKQSPVTGIFLGVLTLAVAVLFFFNLSLNSEIEKQNKKIEDLEVTNQQLAILIEQLHPEEVQIQGNNVYYIPKVEEPVTEPATEPATEMTDELPLETEAQETPEETEINHDT